MTTLAELKQQNERLEKCSICKRVFWDKRCPNCIREILDKQMKEILEKIDKVYKKYGFAREYSSARKLG